MTLLQEMLDMAARGDERALKRAYAQALRQAGPDEDPVAFQALQSAYERALACCRRVTAGDTESGPAASWTGPQTAARRWEPAPAQPSADALAMAGQPNPRRVSDDLLAQAGSTDPVAFATYVRALRDTWSLDMRDAVAAHVLRALYDERAPMSLAASEILHEAFCWNEVGCGISAYELRWLGERSFQAWLQLPAQEVTRAECIEAHGGGWITPEKATRRLQQLQQPNARWRNLCSALPCGAARQVVALLSALQYRAHMPPPPGIDAGQARFWLSADAPPLHREPIQILVVRSLLVGLLLSLGALSLYLTPSLSTQPITMHPKAVNTLALAGMFGPLVAATAFIGLRLLLAWQVAPETAQGPGRWWRWLAVPVLCAVTGAAALFTYRSMDVLSGGTGATLLVLVLLSSWTTVTTAWLRLQVRRGSSPWAYQPWVLPAMVGIVTVVPALAAALIMWGMDGYRHRALLRGKPED